MMTRTRISVLVITLLVATQAEADPSYTKFDVPGAYSTVASGIDNGGTVGGYFLALHGRCSAGCGYTRAADGTISTFKVKGCTSDLQISGMNALGDMVGSCRARNGRFSFVRSADGAISRVKNMRGSTATLDKISENGISGGYFYSEYGNQPFLRLPDGSKHALKGVRKQVGSVEGVSPSGLLTGEIAVVPSDPAEAFVYSLGTKILKFSVPNSSWASGGAINDAGDVSGVCGGPGKSQQGFVRNANGSFEMFDLGVGETGRIEVSSMPTVGTDREIVGSETNDANTPHWSGFIRHENGTVETFDVSGNKAPYGGTVVTAAEDSGVAVGYYIDHQGRYHSYIRTP